MTEATGGIRAPRQTAVLVGQDEAEARMLAAAGSGRLHHAWLLSGPRGVGKATLAFRFARFLLNGGSGEGGLFGGRPSLDLPPAHPVFRRVAAGAHPDLLTIERGLNERGRQRDEIVVADVRRVTAFLHRTAGEGDWRIVVVDAADELNRNAANGLLKILEEPPRRALLILVCHNPGRLPATIRSRCRRLALRRLSVEETIGVVTEHRPDLDPREAQALARLAEGSPGQALRLAAQGGAELFRALIETVAEAPRLDVEKLHALADRLAGAGGRDAFDVFSSLWPWWIRRIVREGVVRPRTAAQEALDIVPGEAALLARLGAAAPLDRWSELWEKTVRLLDGAEALNLDRKQAAVAVLLAFQATVRGAPAAAR